jgi:hypothetical protein
MAGKVGLSLVFFGYASHMLFSSRPRGLRSIAVGLECVQMILEYLVRGCQTVLDQSVPAFELLVGVG